jgi:soluble lytic murein transglycosylase
MRRPAIALAAVGLGALSLLAATPDRLSAPPETCTGAPVLFPDSLAAAGRFWHASRVLTPLRGSGPLGADSALLRARVAAGLNRFADVDALLGRIRGADSLAEVLLFAAAADERAERWRAAELKYRRLLSRPGALPVARAAAPRLAFVLERSGPRDSAVAAWRRAAQLYPEIADWFGIRRAALESDTLMAYASVSGPRTPGAAMSGQLLVAGRRAAAGNLIGALVIYQRYGTPLDIARVEYALGRAVVARNRADSLLARDPLNPYNPNALLAATFLTQRFDVLTLAENILVSRIYRVHGDRVAAARFARAAIASGARLRPDTSVQGWLELARIAMEQKDLAASRRAIDSAATRAGRRRPGIIAAARVQALVAVDRLDQADTLLGELIRAHPGDTAIARVVLQLADRHRIKGETDPERARYRVLLARFPEAPATATARFRAGLAWYVNHDHDSALALVAGAARRDSSRALGLGPRYWEARIRFERGDSTAITALRAIAAEQPTAFYGVRAREILGDTTFLSAALPPPPRMGSFPPARARERIRLLASLGLDQEARAEAVGWASDSTVSVQVLVAAARAAGDAGLARESITLGDAGRVRAGMVPGVARALFPYPYRAVIEAEAAEHCVDPLLLAALIRQESRFDVRAVSVVGARGLGQIMPATGQEIAARRRLGPWDPALLFVADFNLHLSARYVADRLTENGFPVYALLASYNAGPARVTRWKNWPEYGDPDLFAERVMISQTRDYVRTVYASYVWYRYAWAPPPVAPAEPPSPPLP